MDGKPATKTRKCHLPSSTPKVTASAEQYDQHDDENDERCRIHINFSFYFVEHLCPFWIFPFTAFSVKQCQPHDA